MVDLNKTGNTTETSEVTLSSVERMTHSATTIAPSATISDNSSTIAPSVTISDNSLRTAPSATISAITNSSTAAPSPTLSPTSSTIAPSPTISNAVTHSTQFKDHTHEAEVSNFYTTETTHIQSTAVFDITSSKIPQPIINYDNSQSTDGHITQPTTSFEIIQLVNSSYDASQSTSYSVTTLKETNAATSQLSQSTDTVNLSDTQDVIYYTNVSPTILLSDTSAVNEVQKMTSTSSHSGYGSSNIDITSELTTVPGTDGLETLQTEKNLRVLRQKINPFNQQKHWMSL